MATIKSFTDISQSKHLLELGLNPETADMYWSKRKAIPEYTDIPEHPEVLDLVAESMGIVDTPAWSLAALLSVLPTKLQIVLAINDFQGDRKEKYVIGSVEHDKYDCYADNPVDACVAMIEKLHELKML